MGAWRTGRSMDETKRGMIMDKNIKWDKNYDFAMLSMMKKNWTDAELAELGLSKSQIEKYREYEKQQ